MWKLEIILLSLLKISYEVIIGLIVLIFLMSIITLIKGDKYYFTKRINELRRYMYGKL